MLNVQSITLVIGKDCIGIQDTSLESLESLDNRVLYERDFIRSLCLVDCTQITSIVFTPVNVPERNAEQVKLSRERAYQRAYREHVRACMFALVLLFALCECFVPDDNTEHYKQAFKHSSKLIRGILAESV